MSFGYSQKLVAEALGTGVLVAAVVGSGIMADRLTDDVALALLANTLATAAALVVLITTLGPISGAHFNPAVSLVMMLTGDLRRTELGGYVAAQVTGGIAGVLLAHAMFGLPLVTWSETARTGGAQWLSEAVAAFGLVFTILAAVKFAKGSVAWMAGLYIASAYWFTSSTSFANPAVAIARAFTNTFSGIRPIDLPEFIIAEFAGALVALALSAWLLREKTT